LICQHCSAVNKNKFTLLTHTYALLFPPVFSWLPGGEGSHPGPCVSLPAAKGLICSATLTLRLQPENRPSPTGGHPFLKKKRSHGEKSWKTKHCCIRWTSCKILFSNPDAHISFDSHWAAKFVL